MSGASDAVIRRRGGTVPPRPPACPLIGDVLVPLGGGAIPMMIVMTIGLYVLYAYYLSQVFERVGSERWLAWVPIVNTWRLLEIARYPGLLVVLGLIPFFGQLALLVLAAMAVHRINEGFGKGTLWTVLYIFLAPAWSFALASSDAEWNGGDWRERLQGQRFVLGQSAKGTSDRNGRR